MSYAGHNLFSDVNQIELSTRLISLTENTDYTLTQINGQRIYRKAPHAWPGPEPSRNCELKFDEMAPFECNSSNEIYQYDLSSRLISLTENTEYTLTQINGQRIYRKAPHAWLGPEPSRSCEVFIGRIPHDCFEDILVPLFSRAGELFEFRLMINFSGWNRGYAFAMYTTAGDAAKAISLFNKYMIRHSWQLGVCPSINNCRIFISRIPLTTSSAEIVRLLYTLTDEVKEVRIRRTITSCVSIVEYRSHRGAAMARKALVSAASAAWGVGARPAVDWSLPQSAQSLKQYREIGRWTPEHGVELVRVPADYPNQNSSTQLGAPSYTLEPWSQVRRQRMIQDAQRNARVEAYNRMINAVDTDSVSMWSSSSAGSQPGTGLGVWTPSTSSQATASPPSASLPLADFNPWTAHHPLQEFLSTKKDDNQ